MVKFQKSYEDGELHVNKLCEYLKEKNVGVQFATLDQQLKGIDLIINNEKYEIKKQLDPECVIIEETGTCGKKGWFYTSEATYIVEICHDGTGMIIELSKLKQAMETLKNTYGIHLNEPTDGWYGDKWQSSYRRIPSDLIEEYAEGKRFRWK